MAAAAGERPCRFDDLARLPAAVASEPSAHSTPDAAREYVKKTERQREAAARKRRAWIEQERIEAKLRMMGVSLVRMTTADRLKSLKNMVGAVGLEPTTR